MKKLLITLGILFSLNTFAQSGDAVAGALKAGDVAKFTSYFSNSVDVKLPEKNEMKNISKSDAASVISGFFSANNISGFDVISQREMNGTMYITGKLKGAKNYNITVMLMETGNNKGVITVRIL
jgi:hypothetical protein